MSVRSTLPSLTALAAVALIGAGCANSGGDETQSTRHAKAMKFAACMRDHGVRDFPDPDASSELTIDGIANHSSVDTSTAAFGQAMRACKDLEPSGFTGHKRTAQEQRNALRFAQCMRDNGISDFPDPTPDGALIDTNRIPSAAGRGARSIPGFQDAMEQCRDLLTGALGR